MVSAVFCLLAIEAVDPLAGVDDGGDHGARRVRVLLHPFGGGAEHLFRVIDPDVLRGHGGEADAVHDRAVVPRLADAEAVHVADAHVGHHLRRRHGDRLDVLHRIDAVRRQPVVQPHGVGAGREGLGEGVVLFLLGDQCGQARAVDRALVPQLVGKRDGLTVMVQAHQVGHVLLRPADAKLDAVDQAVQHVGGVEFAIDQLVAHRSPRGFLGRDDLDAVLLVEFHHRGHDHRGAVGQRDEADADFLLFGGVGTSGPGAAANAGGYHGHQRCSQCG